MNSEVEDWKRAAAQRALQLVTDGMTLGLGTGTTVRYFIEGLGELVEQGMRLRAVPTSRASAELALAVGLTVVEDDHRIELAVDGADEIDPRMNLIKGRGGALFREKLVALASDRFVVIADSSKLVDRLGVGVLPVEVAPFLWRQTARRLGALGAGWDLRGGPEHPFRTDNANLIVDLTFPGGISEPERLATEIKGTTGVLDHGLFLGLTTACLVAGPGGLQVMGSLD